MKRIPLTQGQHAIVDDEDYEYLSQWKWFAQWNPTTRTFYAARQSHVRVGKQRPIHMHREVLGLPSGDPRFGDHKEAGQTLDNRRSNLRIANPSQSAANTRKRKDNTSGFKGVDWHKATQKWRARISKDNQPILIGYYPTAEMAHKAYCEAASKVHGEFARTA